MASNENGAPSVRGEEDNAAIRHDASEDEEPRSHRRLATLYDAVSGRLSNKDARYTENERDRSDPYHKQYSTREAPYAPDEVLFRRKEAPQRYAEYDIYASHLRDLPQGGQGVLPESDLLKAIHSYTSHCYGALRRQGLVEDQQDGVDVNERSMDETALLAFGVLLEEAGREVLGRRGDLVFTEADGEVRGNSRTAPGPDEASGVSAAVPIVDEEPQTETHFPLRKRRKLARADDGGS